MIEKNRENLKNTCYTLMPNKERISLAEIERSLIKRYRKHIWRKFIRAIKEYELIDNGDRIAVAVSGGKDSLLMAKLLQGLQKHRNLKFDLEFIAMDPGYLPGVRKHLIENCDYLNIPIHIFESGIFEITSRIAKENPCYLCARMRRGALYGKAQELGCNKLALGHHFNDVIETILLNVLYAGNFKTMMPKLKSQNHKDIELIRPLYLIEERYIERFISYSGIWPLNCACTVAAEKTSSKRKEIKELIKSLKKDSENVDISIFRSAENVNLNSILGWKEGENKQSFLEEY